MRLRPSTALQAIAMSSCASAAFPWASDAAPQAQRPSQRLGERPTSVSPSDLLQSGVPRSEVYHIALAELQELEAQPLCHRVAARLLVSNCQLLEGKDDATIHTDSGRQARDFVDAYAASLALCDLERASFALPRACAPFREPVLRALPPSDTAQLHVSEGQIRACLAGLGESPSAWNTWVSYSHKALRFCEAARADHEKTQNILVFQKLTRVMAKLAGDVEDELQRRMASWEAAASQAEARLHRAVPAADAVWQRLVALQTQLDTGLGASLERALASTQTSEQAAETLQQMLALLIKTALDGNAQLAFAHETAVAQAAGQTQHDLGVFVAAMGTALESAAMLHGQIDTAHAQASALVRRQDHLEEGMARLAGLAQRVHADVASQTLLLAQASNMTDEVLGMLASTAAAATLIREAYPNAAVLGWWPFAVCPVATLVVGSYGLPPSLTRNLGLVAAGSVLALFMSYTQQLAQVAGVLLHFAGV